MELNKDLIKVLIAGAIFVSLLIAKKKKTKNTLLWLLIGYLIYLGVA